MAETVGCEHARVDERAASTREVERGETGVWQPGIFLEDQGIVAPSSSRSHRRQTLSVSFIGYGVQDIR